METDLVGLSGYYTYRSFLNNPLPVNDFNMIKSVEAELFLVIEVNGTLTGTLSFPADPETHEKTFMNITGNIKNWSQPIHLEFKATGRPNTAIFDYLYEYSCSVSKEWEKGIGQSLSLVGSVLRAQDHGLDDQIAKAGETASFIAVKRDFREPRDIQGVTIIPSALSMLASKSHRLTHAVWHTIRSYQIWWKILKDIDKEKISELGWGLDRPPFTADRALDLANGAGEDFLFMHRKMIAMVKDKYASEGVPYIKSWKVLPLPTIHQFFYSEEEDPQSPGKKIYRFNPSESGYMVPPAYFISTGTQNEKQDLDSLQSLKFMKSPNYFTAIMRNLERQFTNTRYLSSLSLGALGNLLEFVIHNPMHMRWSSAPIDPTTGKQPIHSETGKPTGRADYDFGERWDNPKYDYLGDFYSSHVNPVFWRLHGWVDDRIEDWFNAHEAAHQGEIERYEYKGISWFKPGKWVQVSNPFYWPEGHNHGHNHHHEDDDQNSIENMLKVMEIIRQASERVSRIAERKFLGESQDISNIMSFMHDILPHT